MVTDDTRKVGKGKKVFPRRMTGCGQDDDGSGREWRWLDIVCHLRGERRREIAICMAKVKKIKGRESKEETIGLRLIVSKRPV